MVIMIDCILIKLTFLNNDIFPFMHFIYMRYSLENVFLIKINCIYYSHTEYSILKNNMQLTLEHEYINIKYCMIKVEKNVSPSYIDKTIISICISFCIPNASCAYFYTSTMLLSQNHIDNVFISFKL